MLTLPRPGKMQPFGRVNTAGLEERAAWLTKRSIKKESKLWALRTAVSMCDLTTLEGADTEEKVRSLIAKAIKPYTQAHGLPSEEEVACPPVAAICVYPNLVPFAAKLLGNDRRLTIDDSRTETPLVNRKSSIVRRSPLIASVATAFPSGQSPLSTRLAEVKWAIKNGADEIDMVINRNAFLAGDYKIVHKEIEKTKQVMLDAWAQQFPSPVSGRERSVPPPRRARGEGNSPDFSPHPSHSYAGEDLSHRETGEGIPNKTSPLVGEVGERSEPGEGYGLHDDNPPSALRATSPTRGEGSRLGKRKSEIDNPQPPTADRQPPTPPHLKVILETGEIGSYDAVRNASFIAMHAGADFIKTSTGKIPSAANLPVTLCMLEAIRDFYDQTGMRIGMKPAGGIRTAKQAVHYLVVVNETLGPEWLTTDLFRFGASSLLNDLLAQIVKQLTGAYRSAEEFSEV